MIRRPPRSTRTDTSFPTRRSSDLAMRLPRFLISRLAHPILPDATVMESFGRLAMKQSPAKIPAWGRVNSHVRSEEHTSELQSLMRISYAVFCLKKKKKQHKTNR